MSGRETGAVRGFQEFHCRGISRDFSGPCLFVLQWSHFWMLCFVGISVWLVIRSDAITARSLGYLLTQREKRGERIEEKKRGWTRKRKKEGIKVWLRTQSSHILFSCCASMNACTHTRDHEAASDLYWTFVWARSGFMVTHSESVTVFGGGAVTGASVKTKAEWPPCECTWRAPLGWDSDWQWRQHEGVTP